MQRISDKKYGFALVATMTLMILLAGVAVGLMALASSQSRISMQSILVAAAKQQALVGLDVAIGTLQVELGPDKRVSANSGIMVESENNQAAYILGVWNSWDGPIYGQSDSGIADGIQSTYTKGRSNMFRRWLISSCDKTLTRDITAYASLAQRDPGKRICLVGEGTLGRISALNQHVYADLITVPSANNNITQFAWWVGGENQKANLAIQDADQNENLSPAEYLTKTWDTPAASFLDSPSLHYLPETIEVPEKLLSLASLPLLVTGSKPEGTPYFFSATTRSQSLPVNVRDGGLKADLNLLLNKTSLSGTSFARRSNQDCPLVEQGDDVPESSNPNMPIGSWQNMHAFHNTWPNGSGGGDGTFSSRLVGNITSNYTLMSGAIVNDGSEWNEESGYEAKTELETGSTTAGYARTPVMLSMMSSFGLVLYEIPRVLYSEKEDRDYESYELFYPDAPELRTNSLTGEEETFYYCMMFCSPMFSWWNPYNVEMRIPAKKIWVHTLPHRSTRLTSYVRTGENGSRGWGNRGFGPWSRAHDSESMAWDFDYCNYIQADREGSEDLVFQPGEIKVFTYDPQDYISITIPERHSVPLTPGFRPDTSLSYTVGLYPRWITTSTTYTTPTVEEENYNTTSGYTTRNYELENQALSKRTTSYYISNGYFWYKAAFDNDELDVDDGLIYTDGFIYGPQFCATFGLLSGFNGLAEDSITDHTVKNNSNEAHYLSVLPSREGLQGIAPNKYTFNWLDPTAYDQDATELLLTNPGIVTTDEDGASQEGLVAWDLSMTDITNPYFIFSFGITAKSANTSLNLAAVPGDFRNKVWQHSNPAFGGGIVVEYQDQLRAYSPYQVSYKGLGWGMSSAALDTIGDNGYWGADSNGEQVSYISSLELPVHPPYSLAAFAGMRLSPGWFSSGTESSYLARQRNSLYMNGVPAIGIGNSFADPTIPAGDIYANYTANVPDYPAGTSTDALFDCYYDHGLLINDALWDSFFCSSISDRPNSSGSGTVQAESVLQDFLQGDTPLPVSRYKRAPSPYSNDAIVSRIMGEDGWKYIAEFLYIQGGFNINSTSTEAWQAVLLGLAKRELVTNKNGGLSLVEEGRSSTDVLFSRFMLSTTDTSLDSLGDFSMMQGSTSLRSGSGVLGAWGEVRKLDSQGIELLAEEIVKQVRERGPFLNMSDFINRRLDSSTTEHALKGALQTAIDDAGINDDFNESVITSVPSGDLYVFPDAELGSIHTGAPGYLIQSDVLASLGNILTVRDDTFTVRAYGCVKNKNGSILAQAWCEAIVQRTHQFVDGNNAPGDTEKSVDGEDETQLTDVNQVMGRKMKVVSFKWLDIWDI